MSEENKKSRRDRMKNRFGGTDDSQSDDSTEDEPDESESSEPADSGGSSEATSSDVDTPRVVDLKGRTFYVGEETLDELDLLYDEVALDYRRQHGEKLEKSRVFYPALFEAAVSDPSTLREILGLD